MSATFCWHGPRGGSFAHWGVRLLERMIPEALAGSIELGLDSRVVAFTAAVSILTGLLFGLAPAVQLARVNLSSRAAVWHAGRGLEAALEIVGVAFVLGLVIGATLLMKTMGRLRAVEAVFKKTGFQ